MAAVLLKAYEHQFSKGSYAHACFDMRGNCIAEAMLRVVHSRGLKQKRPLLETLPVEWALVP